MLHKVVGRKVIFLVSQNSLALSPIKENIHCTVVPVVTPLYRCIAVSRYCCIAMSLYRCSAVALYCCIAVSMYCCTAVSLYRGIFGTGVSLYRSSLNASSLIPSSISAVCVVHFHIVHTGPGDHGS